MLCLVATSVLSACVGLSEAAEHYNAGMELQKQRRLPRKAIAEYDQAILLSPEHMEPYASRVLAYTCLGVEAEAQQDINRAVEFGFNCALLERMVEQAKQAR